MDPALVTPRGEVLAHELLRNVASASQSLSDSLRSLRGVSPHILDSSSGGLVRDLSLTLATVSMDACASRWCVHLFTLPRAVVGACRLIGCLCPISTRKSYNACRPLTTGPPSTESTAAWQRLQTRSEPRSTDGPVMPCTACYLQAAWCLCCITSRQPSRGRNVLSTSCSGKQLSRRSCYLMVWWLRGCVVTWCPLPHACVCLCPCLRVFACVCRSSSALHCSHRGSHARRTSLPHAIRCAALCLCLCAADASPSPLFGDCITQDAASLLPGLRPGLRERQPGHCIAAPATLCQWNTSCGIATLSCCFCYACGCWRWRF